MGQTDSQFHLHYGNDADAKGDIWKADSANDRVQKFDSKGNFLKFGNEDSKCSSELGKFDNLLKNRKMDRHAHKN